MGFSAGHLSGSGRRGKDLEIGSTRFLVGIIRRKSTRRSHQGWKWYDLRQRAASEAGEVCLSFHCRSRWTKELD